MAQNCLSFTPTERIVQLVNALGLTPAACELGTSAATLSRWLKAQNYKLKRVYVKEREKAS